MNPLTGYWVCMAYTYCYTGCRLVSHALKNIRMRCAVGYPCCNKRWAGTQDLLIRGQEPLPGALQYRSVVQSKTLLHHPKGKDVWEAESREQRAESREQRAESRESAARRLISQREREEEQRMMNKEDNILTTSFMKRWKRTELAPALSPKIVTLCGSPPNAAMFLCTHWSARRWSSRPTFLSVKPDAAKNPKILSLGKRIKNT